MRLNQAEKEMILNHRIQLHPIEEPYFEKRSVSGLILPDGKTRLMVMNQMRPDVFALWRKELGATMFDVSGTSTFTADPDTIVVYHRPGGKVT